jgi:hypothetical protein
MIQSKNLKIEKIEFDDSKEEVEIIYFFQEDDGWRESSIEVLDSNKFDALLYQKFKKTCNDQCEARHFFEHVAEEWEKEVIVTEFLEKENII